MKVAILHEMLIKLGGAEKVVENFMKLFPDATIFTLIYDEKKCGKVFPREKISPQVWKSKTQKRYNLFKKQRFCLALMAISVENFDFSEYDLVICSSSGFAHGAITKPETKFVVYCHSPARYMWDWTNEYKRDLGLNSGWKKYFLKPFIERTFYKNRQWDLMASSRADLIIANSKNTSNRIKKYYRRESKILYPPVETQRFAKILEKNNFEKPFEKYYIIISALTEFKKIEIAISGFNELEENLLIIGAGDFRENLEKLTKKENIKFAGAKYDDELVFLVQNSSGLIFPGEEDFGIVPIEVMSAGKPVFAYKGGGLLETNIEGVTGSFFEDKNGKDFIEKFEIFHKNNLKNIYTKENCINQAKNFSQEIFEKRFLELINKI
ncbi:glycosyltransferase family 4 protein [Candidatus Gracilibacteria bacterium]|nr:MAG: glycosyltransferase family 4 protein [Candidatus Gracilibacteria bacterium]